MRKERRFILLSFFILISASRFAFGNSHQSLGRLLLEADKINLHRDATWQALLQKHSWSHKVDDPNFYLSKSQTSKDELVELISALYSDNAQDLICRFPARTLWLKDRLHLKWINFRSCKELSQFLDEAPAQEISLVFAAENIAQPSSMMGHVFFKLSGVSKSGFPAEHMISFFTEIRDANPLKLIWESLVSGKNGFYTLSPYEENKNFYLYQEHRSIWEYKLNLDSFQKQLLHYNFYELKNISFNYYFHSFNCATLVGNMLAVAWPETRTSHWWMSPLDVVRSIDDPKFTEEINMIPSTRWKISALETQLRPNRETTFKIASRDYENLRGQSQDSQKGWLLLDLASSYNDKQFEESDISINEWRAGKALLRQEKNQVFPDANLTLKDSVNPAETQKDSQIFVGHVGTNSSSRYILGILPAAHALQDDDRQYLNQWELKLGELSIAQDSESDSLVLNSAVLYSVISLSPTTTLMPRNSGLLRVGYEPKIENNLTITESPFLEGGLGKTVRLHPAIDVHGLIVTGYQYHLESPFFIEAQLGIRILESKGFRSQLVGKSQHRLEGLAVSSINFMQTFNTDSFAISAGFNHIISSNAGLQEVSASQNVFDLSVKSFF